MSDNPFRGTPRQKTIDKMNTLELRRRVKILLEQTEREEAGWLEMPPDARQPGMIGGYLYAVEIYRLLGLGSADPRTPDPVTATDPRKPS